MERFELFRQRVISTGLREGPDAALSLLDEGASAYEAHASALRWWRASLMAESGRGAECVALLREALDAGEWWSEVILRRHRDFGRMQGDPAFEEVVAACAARRAAAESGPGLLIAEPAESTGSEPPSLLVALHGSGPAARATLRPWRSATEDGWLVAAPISSQLAAPGAPTWWDYADAIAEIRAHVEAIQSERTVGRIVIAGFSRGGAIAAEAAVRGDVDAAGLIAIAPGVFDVEAVSANAESARDRGLRAFILVGDRDVYCRDSAHDLMAALAAGGVPCEIETRPDLGHEFPRDMDRILRREIGAVASMPAT